MAQPKAREGTIIIPPAKYKHTFKIVVIGERGTGKTSIVQRFVNGAFSSSYKATIGVDFALKVVRWDKDTEITLQLWDIASQERFGSMTRVYYKEANAAIVVFDLSNATTFEAVDKWKQDFDEKTAATTTPTTNTPTDSNGNNTLPAVLLANKCDLVSQRLSSEASGRMDQYCSERGFSGWEETSAKENINIGKVTKFLIGQLLERMSHCNSYNNNNNNNQRPSSDDDDDAADDNICESEVSFKLRGDNQRSIAKLQKVACCGS